MHKIFRLFYFLGGWKFDDTVPPKDYRRSVTIALPHTSNWDFVYAMGGFDLAQANPRFTIKDSMMRFPLNLIIGPMGGIAINRRPKKEGEVRESLVDAMIRLFDEHDELLMMVTPEGTRSLRTKWKTGFYYVALGAKVPIALSYCDFEKKIAGVGKLIWPTGDIDKDMREIMEFYKDKVGKHPEKFSLDLRYV